MSVNDPMLDTIAALVDGDVIDLSLPEYRAVLEAIDEEEES